MKDQSERIVVVDTARAAYRHNSKMTEKEFYAWHKKFFKKDRDDVTTKAYNHYKSYLEHP